MNDPSPATAISPLRQRLIDDMNVRRFSRETRRNYIPRPPGRARLESAAISGARTAVYARLRRD
jgi:hypothetical protein